MTSHAGRDITELLERPSEPALFVEGRHEHGDLHARILHQGSHAGERTYLACEAQKCHSPRALSNGRTVVHLGGRFVEEDDARVRVTDRGYLLGEGVFATMRGYGGVCFKSREHLATMARGAAMFGLPLPMTVEALAELCDEAARRSEAETAYVRVTLARDGGDGSVLSILAKAFEVPPPSAYDSGIDAITVSLRRPPPACGDPTIKSTSYGREVLVRREVAARNAGEGIMLAVDGSLACGTMSNLFVVKGNDLFTPERASGCRCGVTRAAVIALASRLDLRVREERLAPSVLDDADEVFFASTRVECVPVARIDGKPTRGRYERTHAMRAALLDLVREDTASRRAAVKSA